MIQAVERSSTATPAPSAGNFDDLSSGAELSARVSQDVAIVLLRSALSDVERRARNIGSVLWLMATSSKVDEDASEAMLAIENMLRDLRDVAAGGQMVEVVQ